MNVIARAKTRLKISAAEMERRQEALRQADASNRIEGVFREPETDAIFEALTQGEVDDDEAVRLLKALTLSR